MEEPVQKPFTPKITIKMSVFLVFAVFVGFLFGKFSYADKGTSVSIIFPDGREVIAEKNIATEKITSSGETFDFSPAKDTTPGYFASSKGKKYYPVGCSAGASIKNKIYFKTSGEAEVKGYSLSKSCK